MAQLKDLMVYGDAKFLANAMLDHDPTLNLEAATKHYVDQAVSGSPQGTVTSITLTQGTGISVSNSGTAITTSGTRTIALDQAFGTEFIAGTQTAATGSWTGVTKRAALYDGMQIAYWLPFAGSSSGDTLNLTLSGGGTTGAVNCYYNGASRLTTHYGAGNLVHLTYRSNVNIGGTSYTGWWSNANYDSNDGYCNRFIYSNSYKSGTVGLFPYALVMERSDGTLDSIITSSSTGTAKACNANGFRLPRVLYYNSTTAASTALATYALYEAYTNLIDARYSFNITTSSLTARLPVYLVGAIGTNGLFFLDTTQWWSQTLPSSNDGKVYIHVGEAYDGYRIILNYDKPIYKYINGMVQQWVPSTGYAASAGTAASATRATNDDSGHQISTYYAHTLTTSGNTIGLEDGNGDDISGSFITVPYATSAGSATSATNASTLLGGTSGQVLVSNGTSGVWSTASVDTWGKTSGGALYAPYGVSAASALSSLTGTYIITTNNAEQVFRVIDDSTANTGLAFIGHGGLKYSFSGTAAANATSYSYSSGYAFYNPAIISETPKLWSNLKYKAYPYDSTIAARPSSVTMNSDNSVTLNFASSLNPTSSATGLMWGNTVDSKSPAFLFGNGLYAKGQAAMVIGTLCGTEANNSFVLGQMVYNSGPGTIIIGIRNYNSGEFSVVFGADNVNKVNYNLVTGKGHDVETSAVGAVVVGQYSSVSSSTIFAIGNGTGYTARSNAFEVLTDGSVKATGTITVNGTAVSLDGHTHTNMVTGSGLTSGYFVVGNSSSAVKISTMQPTTSSTTWSTSSDVNVPTMKAISSYVTGLGYTSNTGTVTSVGFSAGTGISLSGNTTINTSGTVTITNSGVVGIKIGGNSATAQTGTVIFNAFSGTDGDSAGTIGLVPAPPATTAKQFLTNQGTWGVISASDIPTLGYLPLTGGTLTPPANSGSRAPLVIDCSAMTNTAWTEGIRIKPAANGWTSLMLCGTDNTATQNSSANSWSMHTYQGAFYLSRNGSTTADQQLTCYGGLWTIKSNSTTTSNGILTVTSSAANANAHVLLDLLAPSLSAGSSGSYSTAWLRLGVALNTRNSGCLGFHYVGSGSTSNYLGLGLYAVDYVLNIVGTGRVGIQNTAPISELDVTGGISWSSKATSQYNATDDCVEFVFV